MYFALQNLNSFEAILPGTNRPARKATPMNHRFISRLLPLEDARSPHIISAHHYWLGLRGEREMPSRADVRPEDMRKILGNIMMVEVTYDPVHFRYALFGTYITASYGYDMTGKSVRELKPEGMNDLVWSLYEEALDARVPLVHAIGIETPAERVEFERVTLPLSSDGQTIDRFVGVSDYTAEFQKKIEELIEMPRAAE